jgi:hypothetical protein
MISNLVRILLLTSICGVAFAGISQSPEIDASSGVAAVALLSGGLLVLQTRRRRNSGKKS